MKIEVGGGSLKKYDTIFFNFDFLNYNTLHICMMSPIESAFIVIW